VRVFQQKSTLEDAIEFHAFAPLQASLRVTNAIPLGCPLFLPVHTANSVQTLKVQCAGAAAAPSGQQHRRVKEGIDCTVIAFGGRFFGDRNPNPEVSF
jgi:hypothetical protein